MGSDADFCCFKGMTYVAFTLCYKLRSFYVAFCLIHSLLVASH